MTQQPQHNRTLKWEPHWITPPELYKKLDDEFHFNYDPCPFPKPKDYNGIEANWGTSNYVNPPFHPENGIGPTAFVRKAIEENKKGKTVVLTIPTQSYVNLLLEAGAELRSLGRVKWLHTVTREPMKGPSPITAFILRSSPNRLQHCDHECVCPDYFDGGGFPCDGILIPEIGKREKCPHDTRASLPAASCTWKLDDVYGMYETGCGNAFECIEGDIEENNFKFCPYCGGRIKEIVEGAQ